MEKPMNYPPPYEPGFNNSGYSQPPPSAPPPHTVVHHMQPAAPSHTTVVVSGGGGGGLPGCPVCHNNNWRSSWGCCAWMWLICCFPIGIVCCLCMREKKCSQCGYTIG